MDIINSMSYTYTCFNALCLILFLLYLSLFSLLYIFGIINPDT